MNKVIECQNLSHYFSDGELTTTVLKDINLDIEQGQRIGIIGTSGSGKSTLLNLMAGIDQPRQGQVRLMQQPLAKLSENKRCQLRAKHLGFVYQAHHLLSEFDALNNVMMPLLIQNIDKKKAAEKAKTILTDIGLAHRLTHKPAELSGGERQRVAVARALVHQPNCILADEPTGNLDDSNAEQVFDLMLSLNKQHKCTLVVVTHDKTLAKKLDQTWQLSNQTIKQV